MFAKDELNKVLSKYVKYVVTQAKANLTRKDKNASKKLHSSIKGNSKVSKNSIGIYFEMEEYGAFQDLGVKGKASSRKAPESPFRFGSGTGRKGGLTNAILEWVKLKRIQFKDKNSSRFMSYESTAFIITRSIYQTGIKPSRFFSKPMEDGFKKLPDDVIEAYGLDSEKLIKQALNIKK